MAINRPNIVVVYVDDVSPDTWAKMSLFPALTHVSRYTQAVMTTSLCGASRMSLFTGQYASHHGAVSHPLLASVAPALATDMLAYRLARAGYNTALVGKYLNGYPWLQGDTYIPAGWHNWHAFLDDSALGGTHASHTGPAYGTSDGQGYVLNRNGVLETHGTFSAGAWQTTSGSVTGAVDGFTTVGSSGGSGDRITNTTTDYSTDLLSNIAQSQLAKLRPPFFLYVATRATHAKVAVASRHASYRSGLTASRSSAFNESDVSDKPAWVRGLVPNTMGSNSTYHADVTATAADAEQMDRWAAIQPVDEMLYDLYQVLSFGGLLSNTLIFVMCDNGFVVGQHRMRQKDVPYEESIRSNLYVHHPDVAAFTDTSTLVANVDIMPTILDVAGVRATRPVDGQSLIPSLQAGGGGHRRSILIEWSNNDDAPEVPSFTSLVEHDASGPSRKLNRYGRLRDKRTITVTTTNTSAAITAAAGTFDPTDDNLKLIVAAGIPTGTTLTAVTDDQHATMSSPATASASVSATLGGQLSGSTAISIDQVGSGGPQPTYTAEDELYALDTDPAELVNVAGSNAAELARLRERHRVMLAARG